jgi:hypothetical protein
MGIVPQADSDKHTKTALKRDNRDQHGPLRGALTDVSGVSQTNTPFHILERDEKGYQRRRSSDESESDISDLELLA